MEELRALVVSAQDGDLEAYGKIVRRFQDMAYGYGYAILGDFHLAEDAAQEAFIEAYRDLSKLKDTSAFPGWFRRIVFKHCDRSARRKRVPTAPLEAAAGVASMEPGPAEAAEKREMKNKVLEAIRSLPKNERVVTTLFYIDGYSVNEIAGFLEVPSGTVKRRLHDSRNRLKERMLAMVETTLQENALPEDFAQRLLMFPFPRTEPEVEIADLPGERLSVRCIDTQCYFLPLVEHGACDWTFYDWPGGNLTGVNEGHVVGMSKWGNRTLFRTWGRETCFKPKCDEGWNEMHILVEDATWRWVELRRAEAGKLLFSEHSHPGAQKDPLFEPVPMNLEVGTKWSGFVSGEVVGVSDVKIDERSWRCLKVVTGGQHFKTKDGSPAAYAEWYVAETGRTVFFRRYNGPGYAKPGQFRSFESLEGNLDVEYQGITFRHSYDCMPDVSLEKVFA